ncbi:hypothetical protein C6N01_13195 [Enterococcus faecalis]|uniref:hypothetical protein n=1 Tax=Enterococcus faecalis TaxID=1351 RepID=UPI0013628A70|nr:hypothetical protein [Enterococcus faecalis]NBJ47163.1 hypothetical protein [Enterococcus faecalis]
MEISKFLLEKIKEKSRKEISLEEFSKIYYKEQKKDLTNKDKLLLASELKYSKSIVIKHTRDKETFRIKTSYLLKKPTKMSRE